ncbi:MAG: hypothetical protein ACKOYM_07630 [Actinomycetes bacterium]
MPAPPPRRDRPARPVESTDGPKGDERWIDEGPAEVRRKGTEGGTKRRRQRNLTVAVPELSTMVGGRRAKTLEGKLSEAATAFAAERYPESRTILGPIVAEVPDLPEARELYGLTLYRLGRWRDAAKELKAFVELSGGSTEQHPVLADCYRALGRHKEVARLWLELKDASPTGELVTEGRIVAAGSLADQGDLAGAVALLSKGFALPKHAREHQLRRAYALADLYERAGDLPQARELFVRIVRIEADYLDAAERAAGLA